MTLTTTEPSVVNLEFSPEEASRQELVLACVMNKIASLPKESIADLAQLALELTQCKNREEYGEIVETIREVMFPELVGKVVTGSAGPTLDTDRLERHMVHIGSAIRDRRAALGWTQEALAEKCDLPQSHISRLEAGQHSPTHKTLEKIAKALDCPVDKLDPSY